MAANAPSSKLTVDATWQKGEFEIVTSDNVRFCIPTHYLTNWS